MNTLEELAVGAAAGACAKAFTTPVSNVVTRRQTASLLGGNSSSGPQQKPPGDLTFGDIVSDIRRERGLLGLWAGYSASLVLTLNPSTTFFLQQMLKRAFVPREDWDDPGARTTFFLAAISKVVATSLTYPFQIAKARVQVSASPDEKSGGRSKGEPEGVAGDASTTNALMSGLRSMARDTIFATVSRIGKEEGVRALYDGIGGELLKGFFNHGTTMLSKDIIHRFIVRLYFTILATLQRYPHIRSRLADRSQDLRQNYLQASLLIAMAVRRQGVRYANRAYDTGERIVAMIMSTSRGNIQDI